MKKVILMMCVLFMYTRCSQTAAPKQIKMEDGFYQVVELGTDSSNFGNISETQTLIDFDKDFLKNDTLEFTKALVDLSEYVPLELEKLPEVQQQTELKKLLLISLTPEAAEKVKGFTEKRVMKQVAIVLNNKVLTVHKIRTAITSGKIQITRCDDNACEYLYVKLKDKVKK